MARLFAVVAILLAPFAHAYDVDVPAFDLSMLSALDNQTVCGKQLDLAAKAAQACINVTAQEAKAGTITLESYETQLCGVCKPGFDNAMANCTVVPPSTEDVVTQTKLLSMTLSGFCHLGKSIRSARTFGIIGAVIAGLCFLCCCCLCLAAIASCLGLLGGKKRSSKTAAEDDAIYDDYGDAEMAETPLAQAY